MKVTIAFVLLATAATAAAIAAGACSSSTSVVLPSDIVPGRTAPPGISFEDGFAVDDPCDDYTAFVGSPEGTAWLVCDDGSWQYTAIDPTNDGYAQYSGSSESFSADSDGGGGAEESIGESDSDDSSGEGGDGSESSET